MNNSLKVAKWELKRNLKNKSFLIGLFITPIIMALFFIVPNLFSDSEPESVHVLIHDELNVFADLQEIVTQNEFVDWELEETPLTENEMVEEIKSEEMTVFFSLDDATLEEGTVNIWMSDDVDKSFVNQLGFLEEPLKQLQFAQLGFSEDEIKMIAQGISFQSGFTEDAEAGSSEGVTEEDPVLLNRLIPGIFAGIILFSIVISGMMIFQSASQEKKDKIAEIILSSLTPQELMQGKIIGYFVLGLIQVFVWIGFALPFVMWQTELPIFQYLLVPELAILLLIAILGYLLFASIFVGLGATIEDVSTSGNFQGFVLMIPFLPLMLLGPVLTNPNGVVATVASYIPLTSPGILMIRLTMLEEWPWIEIIISIAILLISVWLFMKLAGKIFKTGILLYGKNATPKEIWKWLWT